MRLWLVLALAIHAFGAGVQISDTIKTPFTGTLFTGKVVISGPQMTTAAGETVARWQNEYQVTDGIFSVALEPNDTAAPAGTSYSVRYTPNPPRRGPAWSETWIVPTSATTLKVHQVRVLTIPAPGVVILPQQIAANGASSGQCLGWSGSSWQPVDCARPSQLSYAFDFSVHTYSGGTATMTNGSTAVTGTDTAWTPDMTGRYFIPRVSNCSYAFRFTYVSPASGTLEAPYTCPTVSGAYQLSGVISIPAATHRLGTADITIQCFTDASPRVKLDDLAYAIGPLVHPSTYDVEIVMWETRAGRCVLHR